MNVYRHLEREIPYEIIMKHNKNTYFRVHKTGVKIFTNKHQSHDEIMSLLEKHFESLYRYYMKLQQSFWDESKLWGKRINYVFIEKKSFSYDVLENELVISGKGTKEALLKKVLKIEVELKLQQLENELNHILTENKLSQASISVHYLKTKFGSYHRLSHHIKLNSFLALLDPIYLKYVLLHEYAHAKVFNHSAAFYQQLKKMMPEYEIIHKNLKKMVIY